MISIDYNTYIISVPKAYTTFVEINPNTGLEIRQMNVEAFAKDLADLQDDEEGVWAVTAFEYTGPKDVGGIQLAPVVLILAPYTITFEDLQYAVNLVGGNTNLQDFTNVNQVSIRPSNSVGNTFSSAINSQSFTNNQVYIDTTGIYTGVSYPNGTPPRAVNNFDSDAFNIADRENLHSYNLRGTLSVPNTYSLEGVTWVGESLVNSNLILNGQNTMNSVYEHMKVQGEMNGIGTFFSCALYEMTNFFADLRDCGFHDDITLDATATGTMLFKDCCSVVAGTGKPVLDYNNAAIDLSIRGYVGGLEITNFTSNNNCTIDGLSGSVKLDASCTGGVIVVRGDVGLDDQSGPGCIVVDRTTTTLLRELHKIQGLNADYPMVVTPTQRTADDIDLQLTGDGETITVVTRQP